jgi:hypothetical protein
LLPGQGGKTATSGNIKETAIMAATSIFRSFHSKNHGVEGVI